MIRQTAPVFGVANPYQQPGETQLNVSFRGLRSDTHYVLDDEQVQRHTLGTYVINDQRAVDFTLTRALTERFGVSLGVPVISASWSIPSPTAPVPGPRAVQRASGLGDISVLGRYWLLDTRTHKRRNFAAGVGLKMPTGKDDVQGVLPDRNGQNPQPRYVDQSIQPGDGGWGVMLEGQGFTVAGRAQLFASGNYLMNTRNTNGTPSPVVSRLPSGAQPAPTQLNRLVNSVPDQYLARVGGALALRSGVAASIAYRAEGVPRYNLIGRSDGFRRPGVEMFVEPGFSYAKGPTMLSVNVPVAFYRNRRPDPYTGARGDATFPNYIFLATYGYRFGMKKSSPGTALPCAAPEEPKPSPTG